MAGAWGQTGLTTRASIASLWLDFASGENVDWAADYETFE